MNNYWKGRCMIDLTPPLQNHTCAHARKQNNHLEVQCDFYKHEINSYVHTICSTVSGSCSRHAGWPEIWPHEDSWADKCWMSTERSDWANYLHTRLIRRRQTRKRQRKSLMGLGQQAVDIKQASKLQIPFSNPEVIQLFPASTWKYESQGNNELSLVVGCS